MILSAEVRYRQGLLEFEIRTRKTRRNKRLLVESCQASM
jgi:hypothetical protein